MLDEAKKLISLDELAINNEELKKYINSQNIEEVISNEEPEQDKGKFWLQEY